MVDTGLAQPRSRAHFAGLGYAVPKRVLTNDELAAMVDTTDEWITTRTGIRTRHLLDSGEKLSQIASEAGRRALDDAGIPADSLDMVICATTSGDYLWPAMACVIQNNLGAKRASAFDVSAACSGFCYTLATASAFIESGAARNILVVGADCLSRHVNWTDRSTCILFGDGAGAAVLTAGTADAGILTSMLGTDGSMVEHVWMPVGGSAKPVTAEMLAANEFGLQMRGKDVYRFCVETVPKSVVEGLCRVGLKPADVDLLVLHQANLRIVGAVADRLGIDASRCYTNVERYGNTSAASVPIALAEAAQQGRIKPGAIVVTAGFGAGLTWAVNVIKWTGHSCG